MLKSNVNSTTPSSTFVNILTVRIAIVQHMVARHAGPLIYTIQPIHLPVRGSRLPQLRNQGTTCIVELCVEYVRTHVYAKSNECFPALSFGTEAQSRRYKRRHKMQPSMESLVKVVKAAELCSEIPVRPKRSCSTQDGPRTKQNTFRQKLAHATDQCHSNSRTYSSHIVRFPSLTPQTVIGQLFCPIVAKKRNAIDFLVPVRNAGR